MTPDLQPVEQGRRTRRTKLWLALAVVLAIVALLFVPPLVSVSRYKSRVTQVMSTALGRPVRLSSIELRLLPRPGFVFTDLVVDEDPLYGAEPVLHANSVVASIQLLPLWRGRLQISRVSVDEASVNLVHAGAGRWNLDSLFRTAAPRPGASGDKSTALPYIEATNSRINIKDGVEKLPFSLLNADLTLWQERTGEWRLRLRGQPARTDVSLDLPDTGVVRLEATIHAAPQLRQMPLHLDLDWREAQLGQLSRLLIGSDPGWRGDLTGELQVEGTAEAAQVKARLRATGVHRAEFAPVSPLDFDATCAFVYHYSGQSMQDLACDSPVGDGRARLTGQWPAGRKPSLALQLNHVPVQLGLDVLRTLRSGLDPGLQARGAVSGTMIYDSVADHPLQSTDRPAKPRIPGQPPLTGSFTVDGLQLAADGLANPIQIAKVVLEPAPGQPAALVATVPIAAGGSSPLVMTARLGLHGYQVSLRGFSALPRLRQLARITGAADASALAELAGDPVALDVTAEGPWLPAPVVTIGPGYNTGPQANPAPLPVSVPAGSDRLSGTITLHDANWKPAFLANPVEISSAVLHLENRGLRWEPVLFSYGPVKGTGSLVLPAACEPAQACQPHFALHFGSLDAAALQAAILGARESGTLLSTLIARLRPSSTPVWPRLNGTVDADSLVLGPVTLNTATSLVHILPSGAEFTGLRAGLLGGQVDGTGTLSSDEKPSYKLEGNFRGLSAPQVGNLLGLHWTGGALDGAGTIELSGYSDKDLAGSAKGTLHFEWRHGSVLSPPDSDVPAALARFDRWTADAAIANGAISLQKNVVLRGTRRSSVAGAAVLDYPPRVTFTSASDIRTAKR